MNSAQPTVSHESLAHRVVWYAYIITRQLRIALLQNTFGFVSSCKHQPTCGEYFYQELKNKGVVVGGFSGINRLLHCF